MPSSCKEIRAALAQCLQESECVMVQRHTAAECLRSPLAETLPTKCQQLKKGFGNCRRGMIDMRLRFRGNQPVTFKSIEDSNESGDGYQLYSGKSAFAGAVKETSGNEPEAPDWREAENQRYREQQKSKEKASSNGPSPEDSQKQIALLEEQREKEKRQQRQQEQREKLQAMQQNDQNKKGWFPWSS